MNSINEIQLFCNKKFKLNFNGGELSSDGGLLMIKEFLSALGFEKLIKDTFKTTDTATKVVHSGRYIKFNLCSSCPYKDEVCQIFENIWQLKVKLE
ncbi:MAG: transposase [Firmicutes bacterium]|nr:transposase [Bacillota bacterium]